MSEGGTSSLPHRVVPYLLDPSSYLPKSTNPTIARVLKKFIGEWGIGYNPGEGTRSCLAVSTQTA
jgi:hypothetical protein